MKNSKTLAAIALCLAVATLGGCANPRQHNRVEVTADDDGLGSLDVITLANQAGSKLLNTPAVAGKTAPLTIAVAPIRNRAGLNFDAGVFLQRLRLELNRRAAGKLHFVAQGKSQNSLREQVRSDGNSERIQVLLDGVAKEIAALPELSGGSVFAMLPSANVNFVNLNAESYLAFLRTKVVESSARKCRFLLPGKLDGADYYLSGMFIADSDKTEGMVNLADYIADLEKAEREGKSLVEAIETHRVTKTSEQNLFSGERETTRKRFVLRPRLPAETQASPALRERPKVAKYLNVILVDAKSKCSIFEKQIRLEDVSTGIGRADYILSAEISDINKKVAGTRYVLVSVQLIDPRTNIIVWEDGYETKFIR